MKEDFLSCYREKMKIEGKYSDHPLDRGGQTWKGISRVMWPNWKGWGTVDSAIRACTNKEPNGLNRLDVGALNTRLENDPDIERFTQEFYKERFWNPLHCDELPTLLAEELFWTAINCGISSAVKFLQRSLNILNLNGVLYPELDDDGDFGQKTINALNKCLGHKGKDIGMKTLVVYMNVFQGSYYVSIMTRKPDQEAFAWGWAKNITDTMKKIDL